MHFLARMNYGTRLHRRLIIVFDAMCSESLWSVSGENIRADVQQLITQYNVSGSGGGGSSGMSAARDGNKHAGRLSPQVIMPLEECSPNRGKWF